MFDLDEEAMHRAKELGMILVRAGTAGTDPLFVGMLRELIRERIGLGPERRAVGRYPASHDVCPVDCCLPPPRPGRPAN
jgi:protoporphyrin/coproporphyrin ferrochelatase